MSDRSVSCMYNTSSDIIVTIIWSYITVVAVMIPFSIIVPRTFIFCCSLGLVFYMIAEVVGLMWLVLFCWWDRIYRLMPIMLCK